MPPEEKDAIVRNLMADLVAAGWTTADAAAFVQRVCSQTEC